MPETTTTPLAQVRRALRQAGYGLVTTYPVVRGHTPNDTLAFSLWLRASPPGVRCVQEYADGSCFVYTPYGSRLQEVLEALGKEQETQP
jgi:hypothetical protein